MGFQRATCLSKFSCIISIFNLCGLLVGSFSVAWLTMESTFTQVGLFKTCVFGLCFVYDFSETPDVWFMVTRATVVLGCILSLIFVVAIVVYVLFKNETKRLRTVAMVLAFLAGATALAGVILFALTMYMRLSSYGATLGWSFHLTAACAGLFLVVSFLLVIDGMNDRALTLV